MRTQATMLRYSWIGVFMGMLTATGAGAAVTNLWTGSVDTNWFEPGNWSENAVPGDGEHARIPEGTVRAPMLTNATDTLSSFTLENGAILTVKGWQSALHATNILIEGTMTHAPNMTEAPDAMGEWIPEHRILIQGSNMTVAITGALDADSMGYRKERGPGSPAPLGGSRAGAGHGAEGEWARGDGYSRGGLPYGDPAAPVQPGSGSGVHAQSREGGGAIRIDLTGTLDVRGTISAKGQSATANHGGGGSGGSIWITARTIAGTASGLVNVDGGTGRTNAGSGAGGRIAVHYDPVAQSNLAEPRPPVRVSADSIRNKSYFPHPELGTLYLPDTLWITETFDARFSAVSLVIPGFTEWSPASLTLDGAKVQFPDGFDLDIAGDLELSNGSVLYLKAAPVDDPLDEDGARIAVGGDLTLNAGTWIFPYADPTNGATVAIYVADDVFIAANAGIDANFKGYNLGNAPGSGKTGHIYAGAGYGGRGANGSLGHHYGPAYGDPVVPRQPGSCTALDSRYRYGIGGGAIRLTAGGDVVLNGELRANGNQSGDAHTSGGSGGGIHLVCRTLQGAATGLMTARGGSGSGHGGSGGGGRIAVHYDPVAQAALPVPGVRFSTYAPPEPTETQNYNEITEAQMGTLYLTDTLWLETMLSNGQLDSVQLVIPDFETWTPANLSIADSVITLPEGFHLTVTGDLDLHDGAGLHLVAAPTNGMGTLYGARLDVGGDLRIHDGGWLYPEANPTNGAIVRLRVAGDVTIAEGGGIDAYGRGFYPGHGPGAGKALIGGGSHGGLGAGTSPGGLYGTASWPVEPGSPGGWYQPNDLPVSGMGGGVVLLQSGGRITLDGRIEARAKRASFSTGSTRRGAGGSGGSILLLASGNVSGGLTGELDASGGLGRRNVSGGGGRIAVWLHLPLSVQDAALDAGGELTTEPRYPYPSFMGDLRVDSPEGNVDNDETAGEAGSKAFYIRSGTLILLR